MINVLDHGFIRLVDSMGTDLSVIRAARNSYDAAWRAGDDEGNDTKLMNYLWRNNHSTPFEAATLTFEVKAPIFVFRQWHRHRTWSYNEVSARYTELPDDFYVPEREHYGTQSKSNKQVRDIGNVDGFTQADWDRFAQWENEQREMMVQAFRLYKKHISEGMPRELARIVLPMSTYSKMFATVNLLNLLKFLTLRIHTHAQYEIRVYAEAIAELIQPKFPVVSQAWDRYLESHS